MPEYEKIWSQGDFEIWVAWSHLDSFGKANYVLRLKDRRKVIFDDVEFTPSPLFAVDGLRNVISMVGFLILQEGDVEDEYFRHYTQKQLDWIDSSRRDALEDIYFQLAEEAGML